MSRRRLRRPDHNPVPVNLVQGSYTTFAPWYDLIMKAGYYDYPKIASELCDRVSRARARSVLEIGVGTGLIIERYFMDHAHSARLRQVAGIDLTPEMLAIAVDRLSQWGVVLLEQNILDLDLGRQYDLAYSYGGVWYFVPTGTSRMMISHLRRAGDDQRAIERLGRHVSPGGTLLLGVQEPHTTYVRPIRDGMQYGQVIEPLPDGFRKHYTLTRGREVLMSQTTDYRTYSEPEAMELLAAGGFEPTRDQGDLFLTFTRRW